MKKRSDRYPLFQRLSPGGADVSGVTATAPDVDEGKIFVDNTGEQVVGTSTYKADYIALSGNIDELNEDLEEVITGDGTGGGLTVDSVKGLIDGTATTFTIPDGTTSIYRYAFYRHINLISINIPNTVTYIGENAFALCENLELTSLPNSLVTVVANAFNYCQKISISEIPGNVDSIGHQAFRSIASTSITFLGTPTTINSNAFTDCTNLTTIRVPWSEGDVAGAPWGAVNSTIIYEYTPS